MNRTRARGGFTLIELMVVVAIIAIIMAIIVPALLRAKIAANETGCQGTLRTLATAQEQFRNAAVVDVDGDGAGEYGYFVELCGSGTYRVAGCAYSGAPVSPGFITSRLGQSALVSVINVANKGGYLFRIFLPEAEGAASPGIPETVPQTCDPTWADQQEQRWVAYGWPHALRVSGNACYFVSRSGDIFFAPNVTGANYSGETNPVTDGNSALGPGDTNLEGFPPGFPTASQDLMFWSAAGH